MKKGLKSFFKVLIVFEILMGIIVVDTLRALVFNSSPLFKVREQINNTYYVDKGIFVNHYNCSTGVKTVSKNTKYSCVEENIDEVVIDSINDFYSLDLTINSDIRSLQKEYTLEELKKDNFFLEINGRLYNEDLYTKFMDNYYDNKDAYIRVGVTTEAGELIIYDVLYIANNKKVYLVIDNTRDSHSSSKDIVLTEYDKTMQYKDYWVLYTGDESNENLDSINTFYLANIKEYNVFYDKELNDNFIRTYEVLNVADSNEFDYQYLTLRAYQFEEVETVKVLRKLSDEVKSGNYYEFTFLYGNNNISDDIKSIFNNRSLVKIEPTDKIGLDQIMDNVNK